MRSVSGRLRELSPQTLTSSVPLARPISFGDDVWVSRSGNRLSSYTLPFSLTHPCENPLSNDLGNSRSGDCYPPLTVAISSVLQTRKYRRISKCGGRLPTRAVSLGSSSSSVLLRNTLCSWHGKVEERGRKVARNHTTDIMSARALH